MIENSDILSLGYYNYGQPFSGSCRGMRYRLEKLNEEKDEEGAVTRQAGLRAVVWPEPFSFENTDASLMEEKIFEFSEEGKQQAVDWLNGRYEQGGWQERITLTGLEKARKTQEL